MDRALALGGRGPYVLQAAIAVLHTEDPQDWGQIAALYGERPAHRLTRGGAQPSGRPRRGGRSHGGPGLVDGLELDRYHYLHSTRAELLRRLDRTGEARAEYGRALELVHTDAERRFLERRLADLPGR